GGGSHGRWGQGKGVRVESGRNRPTVKCALRFARSAPLYNKSTAGRYNRQNEYDQETKEGGYCVVRPCFRRSMTAAARITRPRTTFCGSLLISMRFMPF